MTKVKILGIGSPFGDDQLGWQAIKLLKQSKLLQAYSSDMLQIESYDRPGVRLLELLADAKIVFLIDAVVTDNVVGTLYRLQDEEIDTTESLLSSHGFGIAQALQLGRALGKLPPIIFYGIVIDTICANNTISPLVEASLNQLVHRVENEVVANIS